MDFLSVYSNLSIMRRVYVYNFCQRQKLEAVLTTNVNKNPIDAVKRGEKSVFVTFAKISERNSKVKKIDSADLYRTDYKLKLKLATDQTLP